MRIYNQASLISTAVFRYLDFDNILLYLLLGCVTRLLSGMIAIGDLAEDSLIHLQSSVTF